MGHPQSVPLLPHSHREEASSQTDSGGSSFSSSIFGQGKGQAAGEVMELMLNGVRWHLAWQCPFPAGTGHLSLNRSPFSPACPASGTACQVAPPMMALQPSLQGRAGGAGKRLGGWRDSASGASQGEGDESRGLPAMPGNDCCVLGSKSSRG